MYLIFPSFLSSLVLPFITRAFFLLSFITSVSDFVCFLPPHLSVLNFVSFLLLRFFSFTIFPLSSVLFFIHLICFSPSQISKPDLFYLPLPSYSFIFIYPLVGFLFNLLTSSSSLSPHFFLAAFTRHINLSPSFTFSYPISFLRLCLSFAYLLNCLLQLHLLRSTFAVVSFCHLNTYKLK